MLIRCRHMRSARGRQLIGEWLGVVLSGSGSLRWARVWMSNTRAVQYMTISAFAQTGCGYIMSLLSMRTILYLLPLQVVLRPPDPPERCHNSSPSVCYLTRVIDSYWHLPILLLSYHFTHPQPSPLCLSSPHRNPLKLLSPSFSVSGRASLSHLPFPNSRQQQR